MGLLRFTRPAFRAAAVAIGLSLAAVSPARAEGPTHGLSVFGELKYPAGFEHFDYVNPDAPKGGRLATMGTGGTKTYDSFNSFILKGDAAQGLEYLFDSLMTRANDEPDAVYGLVAKDAEVASDGMSVTFHLRPEAKFADGTPVTAEDVVFSFVTLKEKGHPSISMSLRDVVSAEALDPHTVRYTFQGKLIRDLPVIVAGLPVLSKAFYTTHKFDETSLVPPLGSGPYRIRDFKPGTFIVYERRKDYWAKDLNVNVGRFNFDELRYDYFRDRNVELQNLLSGTFDLREEFTSVSWATGYDVPAVREGRLIRDTIPDERPSGAQGFFINTRLPKFQDVRVREALGLAFDFEWSNKNLFFELYTRTQSFFENSDMKATGLPSPEEVALLEPYRDKLSPAVFKEPFVPPVTDGTGIPRENLKRAKELLEAAGWKILPEKVEDDCGVFCGLLRMVGIGAAPAVNVARNATGEPLDVEFLIFEEGFERIISPYVKNLRLIGVQATIRQVDPAQYERRMKSFDFDITVQRYALRLTPGIELKSFWGSEAAKTDGSFNLAGISDPVIDALIDKVVEARSRHELVTATRAIDRVLRAGHYWVPHWYKAVHNIAYWNKFSRPKVMPKYDEGIIDTWWYDTAKAATLVQR